MGDPLPINLERLGFVQIGQCLAYQIGYFVDPPFGHEIAEAFDHVLDYPVAVMHDAGGDLQSRGTHQNEFQRIDPGFDAADSGQGQPELLIFGHGGNKIQPDRFDGRA